MKYPKNQKGTLNYIAFRCYKIWSSSFWIRWVLAPIATGVLPALTFAYYKFSAISDYVHKEASWLSNWLDSDAFFILIAIFIYPTALLAFARFVVNRVNSTGVNQDVLLSLVATLDQIVGCKAERFGKYAAELKNNGKNDGIENTFEVITQPITQIAEITRGIYTLFNTLMAERRPRVLVKVVLAVVKDKKISELPIYFPQDEQPGTSIQILNHPNSTMMTALNTKKMVIIESTRKESRKKIGRKFVASDEEDQDSDCSLICFPIRHKFTNTVPFILSIHCDEGGIFNKNEHSQLYEHLLGRFESRICLEYSLMLIKEEVSKT